MLFNCSRLTKGIWGVEGLNETAADILFRSGLIGAREGWYSGRPVMITRNDYSLGLMNGDTGIVLYVNEDNGKKRKNPEGRVPHAGRFSEESAALQAEPC